MNDGNLKRGNPDTQFKSGREAAEAGRKGGIASGRVRGVRAVLRRRMAENPDLSEAVLDALLGAIGEGNVSAIKLYVEMTGDGESDAEKKLRRAQLHKLQADTERIRADTERIQAETELLKRKASDGDDDDGEARAALARALEASAAAAWGDSSDDETGTV